MGGFEGEIWGFDVKSKWVVHGIEAMTEFQSGKLTKLLYP